MILFNEKNKVFYLNTEKTSYIIGLLNGELPVHIYWGKKIDRIPDDWSKTYIRRVLSAYDNGEFSSNSLPQELPDLRQLRIIAFRRCRWPQALTGGRLSLNF